MNRSIEHEGYADDGGGFFMTQNEFNPRDKHLEAIKREVKEDKTPVPHMLAIEHPMVERKQTGPPGHFIALSPRSGATNYTNALQHQVQ